MAGATPKSKQSRKPSKVARWEGFAIAALGAIFLAAVSSSVLPYARTHDFLSFYTGGMIAKTQPARLYDADLQAQIEYGLAPDMPVVTPFTRPAFYSLLCIPLTWMPLFTAFAVWIGLGVATALAIWYWAFRKYGPEALVYCPFFVPLAFGIANGQDTAFVTGLCMLAYAALDAGRKVLGGVLLALLLVKFHLFLLIPVVLLLRREWRILAGYVPTALAAIGVSFAIATPQSYLALLFNPKLAAIDVSPHMMINAHSLAVNFGLDFPVVRALTTLALAAAVLCIPRNAPFDRWFWATICGGLIISPHTFEYDAALLLLPILKVLANRQASGACRWIAATAIIPVPYLMTMLPKPFSATPALVITALFFTIAWPDWFNRRSIAVTVPLPLEPAT